MSTILDALKRVQRDREQARPLDLRESVTAAELPLRRKRRERSRLLPLLVVVLAAGAAVVGYQRVAPLLAGDEDDLLELAMSAPPPEPGIGTPPPAPDPLASAPMPSEPIAALPVAPEVVAQEPALVPEPPPEYPVAQAAPPRAARVPRSLPGQGAPSDPTLETLPTPSAPVAAAPAQPAPTPPEAALPEAPRAETIEPRPPVGKPATRTFPSLPRRVPARTRDVARAETERSRSAAPASKSSSSPSAALRDVKRADEDEFPEIRVSNVVWHPEPSRRRAEVTIEQTRLADAREGDIVKGVEVEKIEPGAVEFKLGSALKTVRIGP